MDPPAEVADGGQAVLHLFRARRDPRAPPRAKEWADRYRGRFDQGWDRLREETIQRQKALGVIPADTELTDRHDEIPAWDDMPAELKPVLVRQMEVYAGFLEYTDHRVGRLVDALQDIGILGDTLVYYVIGDNGASAEGTLHGTFNEMIKFNGAAAIEMPAFMAARLGDFGGPDSYNHYAVGWAHAMDAPLQWTKQVASRWGGTRNGTIVHWPGGFNARGELRDQFHHVIDLAPTVLEVAGLPAPVSVNGVQQMPLHGVSMAYSFDGADEADRHETQYFEMFGNRGIYHKGWTAVTKHKTPWILVGGDMPAFDDDRWELYDTTRDWSQAHDLSAEHPDKLHELQRLWLIEAVKYGVLPLDDRSAERVNPDLAGRPTLIKGNSQLLFGGMGRLSENSVVNIKNKSHAVTAEVVVPESGADGVIVAQGGSIGGWSLYAKGGTVLLFLDGEKVGEGRVAAARADGPRSRGRAVPAGDRRGGQLASDHGPGEGDGQPEPEGQGGRCEGPLSHAASLQQTAFCAITRKG